jgi:hypothetical protein
VGDSDDVTGSLTLVGTKTLELCTKGDSDPFPVLSFPTSVFSLSS